MYKGKRIEKFILKVTKEAEAAAQVIFDKNNDKLIAMIKEQLKPDDVLYLGMGTAALKNDKNDNKFFDSDLDDVLSANENSDYSVSSCFDLPSVINGKSI